MSMKVFWYERWSKILPRLLIACFIMLYQAYGFIEHDYREGELKIIEAIGAKQKGVPVIEMGNMVKFSIPIYASHFFGDYVIKANAEIKNRTGDKVKAVYYISFHDQDGVMIGCHQGMWELAGNDEINYGSALIISTPELVERIPKYKLRIIVSKTE